MQRPFRFLSMRLAVLSGLSLVATGGLHADDNDKSTKRFQTSKTYSFSADESGSVEKSLEAIEKQLRESNLPEAIQRQAIESLRAADPTNARRNLHIQMHADGSKPAEWSIQTFNAGPGNFNFPFPMPGKQRLLKDLEKIVDEEKLEPDVAARLIDKLKAAVEKIGTPNLSLPSRFRIGVVVEAPSDSETEGVTVESVFDDSPAADAGIKAGDRIVSVNGNSIGSAEELMEIVQDSGADGKEITVVVKSGDQEKTLNMKPNKIPMMDFGAPFNPPNNTPNQSQAWVMNPQDLQSMRNQFQFRFGPKDLPGDMGDRIAAAVKDAVEKAMGTRPDADKKSDSAPNDAKAEIDDDDQIEEEILEELEELENEVAEIKAMLKKLSEKKK